MTKSASAVGLKGLLKFDGYPLPLSVTCPVKLQDSVIVPLPLEVVHWLEPAWQWQLVG